MHACRLLLALTALFALGACAHYEAGHGTAVSFDTLYIAPVQNSSYAPQARTLVSTALRDAFLREGRVRLVSSEDEADAVLRVRLVDYDREVAARQAEDTGRAEAYILTLRATATLRAGGRTLFEERPFEADAASFLEGGLTRSEYATLPLMARDLAERIEAASLANW